MKAFAAAAVLAALLAACATVTLAPRDPQPFDLLGRILVTYSGGALTGNLRWEHTSDEDHIWLMTPTGQTLAYIVDSAQGATLTRADQKQYRASSVEALTRQALGWSLPLSLLQYWVRGEAAPGPAELERGADGRVVALTQNGWRVAFNYYSEGETSGLVRRIDLSDGSNEIRLVIDTWRNVT
ncbi:MAG: outer rane lipoprotein LolB [Betaproteobacteria bacterium]|jgi:outer membrane lipoprotein LolB|nr:outer rane lipoprotein LolB [Betaproteobacteria bacterium]MEA3158197.1 outer rane lipoprotein LolB [Betaproteobacteria bacterium]